MKYVFLLSFIIIGPYIFGNESPEIIIQEGVMSCIDTVAIAPDGKTALSGSWDNTLKLWDLFTGKEMRTFSGHSDTVRSIAYTPDGKTALSGSSDKNLKLWDLATGEEIRTFSGHSWSITSVAVSPDGKTAVSGSIGGAVKVWEVETGGELYSLPHSKWGVFSLDISPDGKTCLAGYENGEVLLWDLKEGKEILTFSEHTERVDAVRFSPDRSTALTASMDETIIYWEVSTGREIRKFQDHAYDLAFLPDGKRFVSGTYKEMKLWDLKSGDIIHTFSGHTDMIYSIAVSPDGKSALSSSYDASMVLWDISTGKSFLTFDSHLPWNPNIAVSPGGETGISWSDELIRVWDLTRVKKIFTLSGHSGKVNTAVFSPDGKKVLSGSEDKTIKLWDVTTGEELSSFTGHSDSVYHIKYFSGGKRAISAAEDNRVKVWEISTGKEEASYSLPAFASDLSVVYLTEDRKALLYSSEVIILWDLVQEESVAEREKFGHPVTSMDFSRDGIQALLGYGKTVFSVNEDYTILLFDIVKGGPYSAATFSGHTSPVTSVFLSSDGNKMLSGEENGTVILWDTQTAEPLRTYAGGSGKVIKAVLSEDGATGLVAYKNSIRILNIVTGDWVELIINRDNDEWLVMDPEKHWDSSKNGGELVAVVRGMEVWNIDQFAVRNNRPDTILNNLPNTDRELISHYYRQYLRRLYRLGLKETDLTKDYHIPRAEIRSSEQDGKFMTLDIAFSDNMKMLKSYNIYVNDVPLFGTYGKPLSGYKRNVMETLELTAGENKMEVSCMNEAGAESYRSAVHAWNDRRTEGDLYFIGFGVSKYENEALNLRYADKDAEDLTRLFETTVRGYNRVLARTYTNEEVTRDNIIETKKLLLQASVDDTVVLFISGHGVYDRDEYATYYFLTHETDLENLARTAINFEQLEELLQGIPPRKKLFLMDTCGSGEWEPEMVRKVVQACGNKGVWARIPREERGLATAGNGAGTTSAQVPRAEKSGREDAALEPLQSNARTYLYEKDRYIYNDLVRRSGAIVFSSCRGDEVSYESSEYGNGLFTEYIIRAFGADGNVRPADTDGDGLVSTEELRTFVGAGVSRETEEDPLLYAVPQHPTVDRDNIYVEFGF